MRKTILGLACLLLAAWVLLQGNFGIPVIHINVWPLLVIMGFVYFSAESFYSGNIPLGFIFAIIAFIIANSTYDLLPNISASAVSFAGILACIGVNFLVKPSKKWKLRHFSKHFSGEEIGGEGIVFGSGTRYVNKDNFSYDELTCSFGSAKVYFDNAKIAGDSATFKVEVAFGNATLFVPSSWRVVSKVACAFGGVSQVRDTSEKEKTLYLEGSVAFGHLKVIYI